MSEEVSTDEFRLDLQSFVLGVEVRAGRVGSECIPTELVLVIVERSRLSGWERVFTHANDLGSMNIDQQLVTILGTALTTSSSFNVLIITFLLGEYVTLERQDRTPREKEPYYYALLLLFGVLWVGGIALVLLLGSTFWDSRCLLIFSLGLFLVQLVALILGLSWVGYKTLT